MTISGNTALFLEPNTDTDIIIPARFLKRTSLDGFEQFSFFEKRYLSETVCKPTMEDKDFIFQKKVINPNCLLNHPNSNNATFLVTWANFGCGSSREHAVYALSNYRVIIGSAPQNKSAFADIFRDNCRQNLIRTPVITEAEHGKLVEYVKSKLDSKEVQLCIDPNENRLFSEDKAIDFSYELPVHHEDYISQGTTPFEMARQEVLSDLEKITAWNKKNAEIIDSYPKSVR